MEQQKKKGTGKKALWGVLLAIGAIVLLLAAMGGTILIQQSLRPARPTAAPTAEPTATPEPTPMPDRRYDAEQPLSFTPALEQLGLSADEIETYGEENFGAEYWIDLTPADFRGSVIRHIGLGYSYAVYDGAYYRLGEGDDGKGLVDVLVCDLNDDGEQDLLYSYHFGYGGDAEAKIGWLDPQTGDGCLSQFGLLGGYLALSEENGAYYVWRCTRVVDETGSFALHFQARIGEVIEHDGKLYLLLDGVAS
ncbi:MAG: hypothetical protein IJP98_05865 [Clostridia bacterium]|nr:hypothetical protein [Clostridia bacterium]